MAEVELKVGDTLIIGHCPGKSFTHLDLYRKTRFLGTEKPYDTTTGQGFFTSFFSTGDFDVAELPCEYANKKFVIMGMEELQDKKTHKLRQVIYLKGDAPNSIIWVDLQEAAEALEIEIETFNG